MQTPKWAQRVVGPLAAMLVLAGCSEEAPAAAATETPTVKSQSEALIISASRRGIAYDYYSSPALVPHGVAGDEQVVFVTQPLNGVVSVVDRFTGSEITTLPAPAQGWKLPFAVRVPYRGRLVVLDPGGFPSPTTPSFAHIYEYDYSFNARTRAFSASVTRDIDFTGQPIVFAEDVEVLPGGGYVMSEAIIGQIFKVSPDGAISTAIGPSSFDPAAAIPALGPCLFTPIMVGDVPFSLPGSLAPGVVGLAVDSTNLYFSSTCTGGVSKVPLSALSDSRTPWERASSISTVSARPASVVEEALESITFNRFDPSDRHLYATDSFQRRVIRINTSTGERQTIVDDANLLDFPVTLQFLPPVAGLTPLIVGSDQEYRLAALNPSIPADILHPPFIVAKVYVFK